MRYPEEKIEEVRASADIVDVAGDYVRLKKSGSQFLGLCPFHDEKTPSFSVDPRNNLFYCFGCHKGGDIFTFVEELEGIGFTEALRLLADRSGVPLPEPSGSDERATEKESIYHALTTAARFYYQQLTDKETGKEARAYLEKRGLAKETVRHFGIGYAPDAWEALLTAAKKEHISAEILEKAGLVKERDKGDGHYDRFRHRLMFPIFSHVGKVLGFGGRALSADEKTPKYINSPETEVYHKSGVLYGLHQGKQAIRGKEEALLVEGYTDVTALHQAGIQHVVASSGTALTSEQVRLLSRYAQRIVLLYDADEAGIQAALRGIRLVVSQGLSAYVVALPGGEDPDTYVADHGAEAFSSYLSEQRRDFVTFMYQQAQAEGRLDHPEDQAKVIDEIVQTVARIPDTLMQETHLRHASDVVGVPQGRLHQVLEDHQKGQKKRPSPPKRAKREEQEHAPAPAPAESLPEERALLRIMLEKGGPLVEFVMGHVALDEFTDGPPRRMATALVDMFEGGAVDPQQFLNGSRGPDLQQLAAGLLMNRYEPSTNWQTRNISVPEYNRDPHEAAAKVMTKLKLTRVDQAITDQKERIFRHNGGGDKELRSLQQEMIELQDLRALIQRREFLEWEDE